MIDRYDEEIRTLDQTLGDLFQSRHIFDGHPIACRKHYQSCGA